MALAEILMEVQRAMSGSWHFSLSAQHCPWNTNPLCHPSAHSQLVPTVSLGQCQLCACASQSKATKMQSVLLVAVEGIAEAMAVGSTCSGIA